MSIISQILGRFGYIKLDPHQRQLLADATRDELQTVYIPPASPIAAEPVRPAAPPRPAPPPVPRRAAPPQPPQPAAPPEPAAADEPSDSEWEQAMARARARADQTADPHPEPATATDDETAAAADSETDGEAAAAAGGEEDWEWKLAMARARAREDEPLHPVAKPAPAEPERVARGSGEHPIARRPAPRRNRAQRPLATARRLATGHKPLPSIFDKR